MAEDRDRESVERVLRAIAVRAQVARRLEGSSAGAVLRSVVEATVSLFDAEAASIALYDAGAGRLVFHVAAGERGQGVVGLSIAPDQGIAGYVFTTGQAIALADVERDPRFGRAVAEQTSYLPRSIVAVPLVDDAGTIGVLEILDRRDGNPFSLRDIELAGVFARQASVAIRASRVERDVAELLRVTLRDLAGLTEATAGAAGSATAEETEATAGADATAGAEADAATIDDIVARATAGLGIDDEEPFWRLVQAVARVRDADPGQAGLLGELLEVLARRSERAGRVRRGGRAGSG